LATPVLGPWPGLNRKTVEGIRMRLFTSSADTFSCSVSAWLALQAEGVLKMGVWGVGRKGWAGRVLLLSLEGYERRSGLRRENPEGRIS
jgi:hypothetical protein